MNARRTALAVLVASAFIAPAAAQAAASSGSGCAPGSPQASLSHDFVVSASSNVRNVKAGNSWLSHVVIERRVGSTRAPAGGVQVELALRMADGHLAAAYGSTDQLGRLSIDLRIPASAAAGYATAIWSASEQIDVPCGPRVHSHGSRTQAKAVRISR